MNRPVYGGYDDRRRSMSPPNAYYNHALPGGGGHREPNHRGGRGGGRGRGRGGGNYDRYNAPAPYAHESYGHEPPPPLPPSSYDTHEAYSAGAYGTHIGYAPPPPPPAPYDGGGPRYEDYGQDKREFAPRVNEKHSSLIESRLQRERPCRTLFIRNIKYETDSTDVRARFEAHGDIKTFFDLISTRGMVFVTFFDLRAAQQAREALQNTELSGRPIDIHFSLPREFERHRPCDREKGQGTLLVTLRQSNLSIDENEVGRKFSQYGELKGTKPVPGRYEQCYVEYWDSRPCEDAHDRLQGKVLQDGIMELEFAWDIPDEPLPPGPVPGSARGVSTPVRDFQGQGRGGGRGRGRGRGGHIDDFDSRRGSYDRERSPFRRDEGRYGHDTPPAGRGRYEDYRARSRSPVRNGGFTDTRSAYPPPPPSADPGASTARLEQARQVQQLLAALKTPAAPTPPPSALAPAPPPPVPAPVLTPLATPGSHAPYGRTPGVWPPPTSGPALAPPKPGSYPPPPNHQPGVWPPQAAPSPMTMSPVGAYPPQPPSTQGAAGSVPPALLAALQQTAVSAASPATPPSGYYPPPQQPQRGIYPNQGAPQPPITATAPTGPTPDMQQILALLAQQHQAK